jgi:hypothetical protein
LPYLVSKLLSAHVNLKPRRLQKWPVRSSFVEAAYDTDFSAGVFDFVSVGEAQVKLLRVVSGLPFNARATKWSPAVLVYRLGHVHTVRPEFSCPVSSSAPYWRGFVAGDAGGAWDFWGRVFWSIQDKKRRARALLYLINAALQVAFPFVNCFEAAPNAVNLRPLRKGVTFALVF